MGRKVIAEREQRISHDDRQFSHNRHLLDVRYTINEGVELLIQA